MNSQILSMIIHGINRINAKKNTSSKASIIRLHDIMMSTMFKQSEGIRQEPPVTAANMTNIVMNYLAPTELDEKAQELLKELCLQMFKDIE